MGNAIARRPDQQMLAPSHGERLFSETEARDEFNALIIQYTPRQLARFSGVTPESARHWIAGVRGPNVASLVNIARALPSVQSWIAARMGIQAREVQASSADTVKRAIYGLASGTGPDALWAQKMIALMTERPSDETSKPTPCDTQTISFLDHLRRRA